MHDPNRLLKWLLVIGLVVLSLVILYPPSEKLKGGIDLVGGTSLLFEIDTADLSAQQQRGLSSKVMSILKDRVDPQGQMNLEWRPVGNTRLEIRMPRPPAEALARRGLYDSALARLSAMNVSRFEVEAALNAPEGEREAAVMALARGVREREPLLRDLLPTYMRYSAARSSGETGEVDAASAAYETALSKVLATNLPVGRLTDVLALPPDKKRGEELEKLRGGFPSFDMAAETPVASKLLTQAVQAYDRWAVQKADLEGPADLKRRIRGSGVLEFRILADRNAASPDNTTEPVQSISQYVSQLLQQGPRTKSGDRFRWFPVENMVRFLHVESMEEVARVKDLPDRPITQEYAGRYYVLIHNDPEYGLLQSSAGSTQAGVKKWALRTAYPDRNPLTGENVVAFALDPRGGQLFGELTGNNVRRQLCIMLDNNAVSHATINERITERCQISGRFTPERVQDLVRTLEAGSLPARLKETPLSEQTIGPSLGETNRRKGMGAAVWGSIVVVAFVTFYYGLIGGGVANLAIALNILLTMAIMTLMNATFTLPGIAGLILMVGMAIDANVLIFERIREERARGVPFRKALNAGYDKAFSAILDGNLTGLITCIILGFVGSEEIRGFAITLGLGLATSMFTALTVTRLIFNTLLSKGWLTDFSMRRLIGVPKIDWIVLRRFFWPASTLVIVIGLGVFMLLSFTDKERVYDIEFLGGTSVQIDLKPAYHFTDEGITDLITSTDADDTTSAVEWLRHAADLLPAAEVGGGEVVGRFSLTSQELSGEQLAALMRESLEGRLQRDGIRVSGSTAVFDTKANELTQVTFREAANQAAAQAREAAERLRRSRVQVVVDIGKARSSGDSFEVVTTETNRGLVETAILAAMGERLSIQRAVSFTAARDEDLTKAPFFVIEADDRYLSDVIPTDANFDIRPFRGGVAIDVRLASHEALLTKADFETRLRQVGLRPEFEQNRTRELAVFPVSEGRPGPDGQVGYNRFAVVGVDEALHYEDDPALWTTTMAETQLHQVEAALGTERAFSKIIQFAPQVAMQTRNKAVFALVLSFIAIAAYVWLRFGTKDYGLAVLVCLVHDVSITIGALALSNFVFGTVVGRTLLIEDFKIDMTAMAAILTIIGYSLNDTIVVFDRIRENKGRAGVLSASMINTAINETMSRTILTSFLVFITVIVLYVFGGAGIHGFSFAMTIGVLSGTYSTVAIAVPLVYRPVVLRRVVWIIVALGLIGLVFTIVPDTTTRWILSILAVIGCGAALVRTTRGLSYSLTVQPATA